MLDILNGEGMPSPKTTMWLFRSNHGQPLVLRNTQPRALFPQSLMLWSSRKGAVNYSKLDRNAINKPMNWFLGDAVNWCRDYNISGIVLDQPGPQLVTIRVDSFPSDYGLIVSDIKPPTTSDVASQISVTPSMMAFWHRRCRDAIAPIASSLGMVASEIPEEVIVLHPSLPGFLQVVIVLSDNRGMTMDIPPGAWSWADDRN